MKAQSPFRVASFYFSTRRGSETVAEYHCRHKFVRGCTVPAVWRGPETDTSEHRVSVLYEAVMPGRSWKPGSAVRASVESTPRINILARATCWMALR